MFDAERTQNQKTAHLFCLCVILLTGMGLVTLYSASYLSRRDFSGKEITLSSDSWFTARLESYFSLFLR